MTSSTGTGFLRFKPIALVGCGSTYGLTAANSASKCSSDFDYFGMSRSVRIAFHPFFGAGPASGKNILVSKCINVPKDTDRTVDLSSLNLPVGYAGLFKFGLDIELFDEPDCSGGIPVNSIGAANSFLGSQFQAPFGSVDRFPLTENGQSLQFVFADTISGKGTSPFDAILPNFKCSGNTHCLSSSLGDDNYDYAISDQGGYARVVVKEINTTALCATASFTISSGGLSGSFSVSNASLTTNGGCEVNISMTTSDSSWSAGNVLTLTNSSAGLSKTIWLFSNSGENIAREHAYDILGHPLGKEIRHEKSGDDFGSGHNDTVLSNIKDFLGAKYIGGMLKAQVPGASCSSLSGSYGPIYLPVDGILESILISVTSSPSKAMPSFICDHDDSQGGTCDVNSFDKKISVYFDNNLEHTFYISCSKKLGLMLRDEYHADGDEYNTEMVLWNAESPAYARIEGYKYSDREGGAEINMSFYRLLKAGNQDEYYLWSSNFHDNGIGGSNSTGADQVAIAGDSSGNMDFYFLNRDDTNNDGVIDANDSYVSTWTDAGGDDFYSNGSIMTGCMNLSTSMDGSTPCTTAVSVVSMDGDAVVNDNYTDGSVQFGGTYLSPSGNFGGWYLGTVQNLDTEIPLIENF